MSCQVVLVICFICKVPLVDAVPHRPPGSLHLGALASLGLPEDREEDDAPAGGDVVADSDALSVQVEAQLTELAPQLPRVRLVEEWALVLQKVDVEGDVPECGVVEAVQPGGDLLLRFDRAPIHSTDA